MKNIIALFLSLAMVVFFSADVTAQCSSSKTSHKYNYKSNASSHAAKVSYTHHRDLVTVASNTDAFATLVAAVKAADLVETLKSEGPFTVFAPTNEAFKQLPEGTLETLLKPENKSTLINILTYHVLSGEFDSKAVVKAIEDNGGRVTLETVSGGKLTAMIASGVIFLKDENGNMSKITRVDVEASNGVIHVIDSVVLPK